MEINTVTNVSNGGKYIQPAVAGAVEIDQPQVEFLKDNSLGNTKQESNLGNHEGKSDKQELTTDEAHQVSKEMNKFMRLLNSNIRFILHEKTNTLIVQVVDSKDNTILKEFPPHELLDTKAKIREYVGILLDKHV